MNNIEIERRLSDTDELGMARWKNVAALILFGEDDLDLQTRIEVEAIVLADYLITGDLSVKQLKQGVRWANACDGEASRALQGLDDDEIHHADTLEATARRIAHHAGRQALECAGTSRKRAPFIARRREYQDVQAIDVNIGVRIK